MTGWKSSAPPILEDEDEMMTIVAEVMAGPHANWKRKRISSHGITEMRQAVAVWWW